MKNNKLSLATMIMGWIALVAMICGFVVGWKWNTMVTADPTFETNWTYLSILIVDQVITLAYGILLLIKAIKMDKASNLTQYKLNLSMSIIVFAFLVLLIGAIVGGFYNANVGNVLAFLWGEILTICVLISAIINTIWFANSIKLATKK